jgi:hypothetical protein
MTSESDNLINRVRSNQCRPKQTDKRELRANRCGVDRLPSSKLAFIESACRAGLIFPLGSHKIQAADH